VGCRKRFVKRSYWNSYGKYFQLDYLIYGPTDGFHVDGIQFWRYMVCKRGRGDVVMEIPDDFILGQLHELHSLNELVMLLLTLSNN